MIIAASSLKLQGVVLKPLGNKEAALKLMEEDIAKFSPTMGQPHHTSVAYKKTKTGKSVTVLKIGKHSFRVVDPENVIRDKVRPLDKKQESIWLRYPKVYKGKVKCELEFTLQYK